MAAIDEIIHVPVGSAAEQFKAKVDFINRRARRLKLGLALSLEQVGEEPRKVSVTRTVFHEGREQRVTDWEARPCALFRISCPAPVIALPGWSFAGVVAAKNAKRDTATGLVEAHSFTPFADVPRVPQAVLDGAFDARGMMRCDHCGTFRNRRTGIVVTDAEGDHKVVGSSCSKDFLGHDYKAVLAYYQHIGHLKAEVDRERELGWYRLVEYDFAARARALEAAQAARDARAYPLRAIVAATLKAMVDQGRYKGHHGGPGDPSTEERALALLEAGLAPSPAILRKAGEIVAWMAEARASYGELAGRSGDVAIGDYRRLDPGFEVVKAYKAAGHPPLGRFHADGDVVKVTWLSSEEVEASVATSYGSKRVLRTAHTLQDEWGGLLVWETTSSKLDDLMRDGIAFRVAFQTKRSYVDGLRARSFVTRLKVVGEPVEG